MQFLFGGSYVWNDLNTVSTTQNAFAMASGGGLDWTVSKHIAIKPIQVEYMMTQIDSTKGFGRHQNDVRYSGGVVFRFGGRGRPALASGHYSPAQSRLPTWSTLFQGSA